MKIPKTLKSLEVKKIWTEITEAFELDESGLIVLKVALESYDRMIEARKILDTEGLTIVTPSGQVKKHPANEIEKTARAGFLMAWRMLNLNIDPPGAIGRPGGS